MLRNVCLVGDNKLGRIDSDGPYFPATWVIGADGKIAWNRDSAGSLEDAIKEALAN